MSKCEHSSEGSTFHLDLVPPTPKVEPPKHFNVTRTGTPISSKDAPNVGTLTEPPKDLKERISGIIANGAMQPMKATNDILALIKLQQEALLAKLEAELPKEKAVVPYDPDVHLTEGHHTQIMAQIIAQNTTIDQVKTTIDKLRLEL